MQDDYVKFFRLGLHQLDASSSGVLGLITNHGFLNGPTFRGMRYFIRETVSGGRFLDLNGNAKREDANRHPGDENVFDIQQGVAISVLWKRGQDVQTPQLEHASIWGGRTEKHRLLLDNSEEIRFDPLTPKPRFFLFEPTTQSEDTDGYDQWLKVDEAMPFGGTGIITNRDGFVIDFEDAPIKKRMVIFRDESISDAEAQKLLGLNENYTWTVAKARKLFRQDSNHNRIRDVSYRPFDDRRIYYQKHVVYNPRFETMGQASSDNMFLLTCRQQLDTGFRHALVTRAMFECCVVSAKSREKTYGFPLYVIDVNATGRLLPEKKRQLNVSKQVHEMFQSQLQVNIVDREDPEAQCEVTGAAVFHYFYSVLHSPGYRSRYAEFLKIDFPRLPLTGNLELFRALVRVGGELVALHLLESPKLDHAITEYLGGRAPEVEKVSWSKNTVWIDKAQTIGFKGVREDVWNFHIGGYQVCEKWLKDRKGRTLSKDDIAHYQKIVVALVETIRLMKEIDEVIARHGGWPVAFQTSEAKAATANVVPFCPRTVEGKPEERYVTCVPLVPLKAAAGAFGNPQHIEDDGFDWAAVESGHRLRPGMFVAHVVGKSMEPAIPDGAWCLFRAPVEGSRQGKTVLVQLREATDPETGARYTVKRYESEKIGKGDSWRHERITLKPLNPDFEPIVVTQRNEADLQVIAELIEVLGAER